MFAVLLKGGEVSHVLRADLRTTLCGRDAAKAVERTAYCCAHAWRQGPFRYPRLICITCSDILWGQDKPPKKAS